MAFIYIIKNTINNKVYIGQTINSLERRFKQHITALSKKNQAITQAMDKYGVNNFYIEALEEGVFTQKELNDLEVEYIKKYNSLSPNGYNLETGGKSKGAVSDETRERMRKAQKGKIVSQETREILRNINTGKKHSQHTRDLISAISLNNWENAEYRDRNLMAHDKAIELLEFKEKMSHVLKERWENEEYRKEMTGWHHSEESKEKISKFQKGRKHSDEQKMKMSEAMKKKWQDESYRENRIKK